jgi:hypothetical protein
MNHTLLPLCFLLLIVNPLQSTQQQRSKELAITPVGPKTSGPRTSMNSSILDQLRLVVRDRQTWARFWNNFAAGPSAPPMPEIDFEKEILVIAAMGTRPSSGYQVIVEKAVLYESYPRLEVTIRSIDNTKCPGLGHLTTLTSPIDIVRIPRTEYPVLFREIDAPDCPKLK